MKSFIVFCLVFVAIQQKAVFAAPSSEENVPTVVTTTDAPADSDASKPLITSTDDKPAEVPPTVTETEPKVEEKKEEEKSTETTETTPETTEKSTDAKKTDDESKKDDDKGFFSILDCFKSMFGGSSGSSGLPDGEYDVEVIIPLDDDSTDSSSSTSLASKVMGLLNTLNIIPQLFGKGAEIIPKSITRETTVTHCITPIEGPPM